MTRPMEILTHPNPVLKQRAAEVDPVTDKDVKRLAEAMAVTMYDAPGVGLAATQVGVQKRLIVLDTGEEEGAHLIALCNPVIEPTSDDLCDDEEGCLSLPGLSVVVNRPASVVCNALDLEGRPVTIEADGMLARVLQHETDHLDGMLIVDRATPEERRAALQRYRDRIEGGGAEQRD